MYKKGDAYYALDEKTNKPEYFSIQEGLEWLIARDSYLIKQIQKNWDMYLDVNKKYQDALARIKELESAPKKQVSTRGGRRKAEIKAFKWQVAKVNQLFQHWLSNGKPTFLNVLEETANREAKTLIANKIIASIKTHGFEDTLARAKEDK